MSIIFRYLFGMTFIFLLTNTSNLEARLVSRTIYFRSISVQLRSNNYQLPTFIYRGSYYVLGSRGRNYSIWIKNRTNRRLEVVVDVDGRDVITGTRANNFTRRGYVLNPYRYVNITGYRTSKRSVAAFRFSTPSNSYTARRGGSWYKIGRIRVGVFEENRPIAYIPQHPLYWRHSRLKNSNSSRKKDQYKALKRRKIYSNSPSSIKHPSRRSRISRRLGGYGYRRIRRNPSLGTAYGRHLYAPSYQTTFKRMTINPSYTIHIHYNSCAGFYRRRIYTSWCRYRFRRPLIQNRRYTPPPR